jgi:hypothetical protein
MAAPHPERHPRWLGAVVPSPVRRHTRAKRGFLHVPAKRFSPGSRCQSGLSYNPDFSHFRFSTCGDSRTCCASAARKGLYGKPPKKRVVPLPRRLPAPLEAYFALNERWVIGSRQVQTSVKRVAGHAGVGSKAWIEPFRGDRQKPPIREPHAGAHAAKAARPPACRTKIENIFNLLGIKVRVRQLILWVATATEPHRAI